MVAALPFLLLYTALSLSLSFCDVRCRQLPDRFTCPLLWGGLIFHLCIIPTQLADAVWGAIAGYGSFAFIYWSYRLVRGREGLGYGDVKFLAALGAAWVDVFTIFSLLGCTAGVFWYRGIGDCLWKVGIKKPAAFWAISGSCGFHHRMLPFHF